MNDKRQELPTITIGKFTNSYKAVLGETSDGYNYRLADNIMNIDDTCFRSCKTFCGIEGAQTALIDVLDFAETLSKAIVHLAEIIKNGGSNDA